MAVVEKFAIGGGCQYLLVMDYVLAASDAYMTLPARKEGIIPAAANLRLPRFVGDRLARQAVMYDRRIDCDSPEGRLVCDQVVPPGEIDTALAEVVERLTSSGVVSAAANRRAFRIAQDYGDMTLADVQKKLEQLAKELAGGGRCSSSPTTRARKARWTCFISTSTARMARCSTRPA